MDIQALSALTIRSFGEGLRKKQFSAREVIEAHFKNIESRDRNIGAYLSLHTESALQNAEEVDRMISSGGKLPELAGVPLAIKDNITIEGTRTTAGSHILDRYIAPYDAGVIKKLKKERAIVLGKTNLDEFAMGSSTENSGFQITRNPHDPKRVPGGSSGGSAAAVAAGLALAGLGSDTGGSVRQPAALSGVVGLKPTYGAVSRAGLIALASSLDQIGPMARTVEDAALLFKAIAGHDTEDATSVNHPYDWETILAAPRANGATFTIGVPKEYMPRTLDPRVTAGIQSVRETLSSCGVRIKEISLPHSHYAVACYYIILPAEASSNLARYDGIRFSRVVKPENAHALRDVYFKQRASFGKEVKRRIILGTFVLSSGYYDAYYKKAQQVRALIRNDFESAFKEVDVILSPTAPSPAFLLGEKTGDPLQMYLADIFTIPVNLAGLPAISIPVAPVTSLPIGFQLIAKPFHEGDLFSLGRLYEAAHTASA